MVSIELDKAECKALAAIAKEHYILDIYVPKPEISESEKALFQQFRVFTRSAKRGAVAADLEQSDDLRAKLSESGYVLELSDAAFRAIVEVLREIIRLLDETDIHTRTGHSKAFYQALIAHSFGA